MLEVSSEGVWAKTLLLGSSKHAGSILVGSKLGANEAAAMEASASAAAGPARECGWVTHGSDASLLAAVSSNMHPSFGCSPAVLQLPDCI